MIVLYKSISLDDTWTSAINSGFNWLASNRGFWAIVSRPDAASASGYSPGLGGNGFDFGLSRPK